MKLEAGPCPAEEESVQPEIPSPERQGFLGRIFGRKQKEEQPEATPKLEEADSGQFQKDRLQMQRDLEEAKQQERLTNPEKIKIPNTPEDLVVLMSQIDAVSWRERKIQERYGEGRMGKVRAFLAGERDFEMTEDGSIKRNAWNELSRKALNTVFNRKTALAAGTLGVVGILTGGVGLPAAGALFGSMVGKGTVEAWHSLNGRERGLKEEMARSQYRQWATLREMALKSQEGSAGELIDTFYQSSEEINVREKEIIKEEKIWNRRRNIGMLLGGLAGAGIGAGLSHLSEQVMRMDIDGDGINHMVEKVNGSWHYVYNTAEEAANAASQGATLVPDTAGYATHALGETSSQVFLGAARNLAPTLAQVGAVFGGLWLGRISEKRAEATAEAEFKQAEAQKKRVYKEEKRFLHERLEQSGGVDAGTVEEESAVPESFVNQAKLENKDVPQTNQIWVYKTTGGFALFKIAEFNWEQGMVKVDELDQGLNKYKERIMGAGDLIKNGFEKSEFIKKFPQEAENIGLAKK